MRCLPVIDLNCWQEHNKLRYMFLSLTAKKSPLDLSWTLYVQNFFSRMIFFSPLVSQWTEKLVSFRDDPKSSRQSVLSFASLLEQVPWEDI